MKKTRSVDVSPEQYAAAVITIFGDESDESLQIATYLDFAYRVIASAISDGGILTDKAVFETIPGRVFELAACVSWIDYFDDGGMPRTDMEGKAKLSGWSVDQAFRDVFMRLLPIQEYYLDVYPPKSVIRVGKEWKHPTPKELIDGFVGTKRRPSKLWLARQMVESPGYIYTYAAAQQFIKLRCTDPKAKRTQDYTGRGEKQAEAVTRIFKKEEPVKYANLKPSQFFWTTAD